MGNGAGHRDMRNDCNLRVDRYGKVAAAGIKSHDRCRDTGDGRLGRYDASILRKFQPSDYAVQWIFSPGFGPFLEIWMFRQMNFS